MRIEKGVRAGSDMPSYFHTRVFDGLTNLQGSVRKEHEKAMS